MIPPEVFAGTIKQRILDALSSCEPVPAETLVKTIYGTTDKRERDRLKNLIQHMKPKLREHGWDIYGRNQLRSRCYQLVCVLLD